MQSNRIISISLIFVLCFSTVSSSYGDLVLQNLKPDISPPGIVESPSQIKLTKDFTISLEEKKIQSTNQEVTVSLLRAPSTDYSNRIQISEGMTVNNADGSGDQIFLLKQSPNQAILDRIFNTRKLKFE